MISSTSSSARETKYEGYAARDGSLLWAKEFAETLHDNFYCSNEPGTHEAAMWLVMGAVGYEAERLVETQLPFFMTQQGDQLAAVAAQTGETVWTSAEHLGQGITFGREDWLGEVGNVLVYSSAAYGITQGYAAATHEFVWENASIQIDALLGSWQKVGVALAVGEYGGRTTVKTMYGLDLNTGEVLWTIEMGSQPLTAIEVVGEWVIWNSYYQTTKHEIHFVNVETGNERLMFPAASAGQGYFGQGEWIFVGTWEQIYLFR